MPHSGRRGGGGGEARVTGEGDTRSLTIRGCQHDRRGYGVLYYSWYDGCQEIRGKYLV